MTISAPINVVASYNNGYISVTWTPPVNPSPDVDHYNIRYVNSLTGYNGGPTPTNPNPPFYDFVTNYQEGPTTFSVQGVGTDDSLGAWSDPSNSLDLKYPSLDVTLSGAPHKVGTYFYSGDINPGGPQGLEAQAVFVPSTAPPVPVSFSGFVSTMMYHDGNFLSQSNPVPTTLYNDDAITSTTNPLPVVEHRSTVADVTSADVSTTVVTLLEVNTHRHQALIHNMGTTELYLKMGADATTDLFSIMLSPNQSYSLESPGVWTGIITAIRASGSGSIMITEFS